MSLDVKDVSKSWSTKWSIQRKSVQSLRSSIAVRLAIDSQKNEINVRAEGHG